MRSACVARRRRPTAARGSSRLRRPVSGRSTTGVLEHHRAAARGPRSGRRPRRTRASARGPGRRHDRRASACRSSSTCPAPFGPSSPNTSPAGTSKSTPFTASTPPAQVLARPRTRSTVGGVVSVCEPCPSDDAAPRKCDADDAMSHSGGRHLVGEEGPLPSARGARMPWIGVPIATLRGRPADSTTSGATTAAGTCSASPRACSVNPTEAEDVVQEAFGRLAVVDLDELDDVGAGSSWLSAGCASTASARRAAAGVRQLGGVARTASLAASRELATDPADRVTLDDQVQLALAVVLDRLSPPSAPPSCSTTCSGSPSRPSARSSAGRPPTCRQLASRARRAIREGSTSETTTSAPTSRTSSTAPSSERFIAACAGGDISDAHAAPRPGRGRGGDDLRLRAVLARQRDGRTSRSGSSACSDPAPKPCSFL